MSDERKQFGNIGESLAAQHLEKLGYKIIERNYKTKLGEIDIVARDCETIVFVEVKARKSIKYGSPKYAVNYKKQKKLTVMASFYLKVTHQSNVKARFDVVSITFDKDIPNIEIIKNAFIVPPFEI